MEVWIMSTLNGGPGIVTNGLVLYLDAANPSSYVSGSTAWNDLTRNGNNGTLTNGPTFSSANGGSIVFDGVDDFVGVTNPINLQMQNFTLSMWVYPTTATFAIADLIDYDHASTPFHGWVLQSEDATTNRYYYLAYYDGSTFQPTTGIGAGKGIQLTNSVWQNITYVKNGTSILGYLNSSQSISYTAGNATVSYQSGRNLRIGAVTTASLSRYYTGRASITSVYNRALSATEIQQNYNTLKSRFNLT